MEFFGEDEYYVNAAQAMIDIDKEKEELAKARAVSNRVTNLGFGDALRKRVAQYADVRDDVRGSKVPKRKRKDANDIRRHLVRSFVPDYGYNVGDGTAFGDGMTLIEHGAHQPVFMDNGNKRYIQYAMNNTDNMMWLPEMSPTLRDKYNKATLISESTRELARRRPLVARDQEHVQRPLATQRCRALGSRGR